jgi:hypothetical protein
MRLDDDDDNNDDAGDHSSNDGGGAATGDPSPAAVYSSGRGASVELGEEGAGQPGADSESEYDDDDSDGGSDYNAGIQRGQQPPGDAFDPDSDGGGEDGEEAAAQDLAGSDVEFDSDDALDMP